MGDNLNLESIKTVAYSSVPISCGDGSQARKQQADRPIYYILYISTLALIGSCSRVFLSRLFGEDCEDGDISDFFTPFLSQICVTAGGRSMQTGGALSRFACQFAGQLPHGIHFPSGCPENQSPSLAQEISPAATR